MPFLSLDQIDNLRKSERCADPCTTLYRNIELAVSVNSRSSARITTRSERIGARVPVRPLTIDYITGTRFGRPFESFT
jgi:hypothetical protein